MMGGGMMDGGFGSGFGTFGLASGLIGQVFNLVILIGIVLLIAWAVQKFSRSSQPELPAGSSTGSVAGRVSSAREVLDARYARGELTREEYRTILGDIS